MPQGKTVANNDRVQIGPRKYHTLLFLTQWEWWIFQRFWLSFALVEQREQAAPAQIKLFPLLSDTLDLFLNGKLGFQFHWFPWQVVLLKKKGPQIFPRILRSPSTTEGWGVRDLPWRTAREVHSLTGTELSVGKGWRQCKTAPTILSSTNWSLERQPPEVYRKAMQFTWVVCMRKTTLGLFLWNRPFTKLGHIYVPLFFPEPHKTESRDQNKRCLKQQSSAAVPTHISVGDYRFD